MPDLVLVMDQGDAEGKVGLPVEETGAGVQGVDLGGRGLGIGPEKLFHLPVPAHRVLNGQPRRLPGGEVGQEADAGGQNMVLHGASLSK